MVPSINQIRFLISGKASPSTTLDPISVIATFALFNALSEQSRFGIHDHKIVIQDSLPIAVPFIGTIGDAQGLLRAFKGDSRDQASDYMNAIKTGLILFKSQFFIGMLESCSLGLKKYIKSYLEEDNSTNTLLLAGSLMEKVLQANKEQKELSEELEPKSLRGLLEFWPENDIKKVHDDLCLIMQKIKDSKNSLAEVKSLKKYLEEKQVQIAPFLKQLDVHR